MEKDTTVRIFELAIVTRLTDFPYVEPELRMLVLGVWTMNKTLGIRNSPPRLDVGGNKTNLVMHRLILNLFA